jgi:hypothetical protein
MGFRPTNIDEGPRTCYSERSEESASSVVHHKSRFLVAALLGMTGLVDFRGRATLGGKRAARSSPRIVWWLLLVTSGLALVPVRKEIDSPHSETGDVLYWGSGERLRHLSLGYEGLLADIYWTRTVQYYGRQRLTMPGGFDLLGPLLQITTTLDPQLIVAYRFGAVFLAEKPPFGAGQPLQALHLLRRGMAANPDYWRFWQDLGFVYYWDLQDYASASRAFRTGSERSGAQSWLRTLAAAVAAKGGERETARLLWSEIDRHADNEQIRRTAQHHLAALAAQEDLGRLNSLLVRYREHFGQSARAVGELVAAGLLSRVPVDPSGVPYVVNSHGQADLSPASGVDLKLVR